MASSKRRDSNDIPRRNPSGGFRPSPVQTNLPVTNNLIDIPFRHAFQAPKEVVIEPLAILVMIDRILCGRFFDRIFHFSAEVDYLIEKNLSNRYYSLSPPVVVGMPR